MTTLEDLTVITARMLELRADIGRITAGPQTPAPIIAAAEPAVTLPASTLARVREHLREILDHTDGWEIGPAWAAYKLLDI